MKLRQSNLEALRPEVQRPRYDRSRLGRGIVHIGVGGFHRAHQAVYADDLFGAGHDLSWGICGVGLLAGDEAMRDALLAQDRLYTLVERGPSGDRARVVGALSGFLFAPEDREAVLEAMAAPQTRIVSLTITEGGYYIHAATGSLNAEHPDLRRDLEHPSEPNCSFGFLLEALDRRRRRGLAPFTLMSCDNIQGNGDTLRRMLLSFAELRDPILAAWMRRECLFPNSMVDRITPATTQEHRALVRGTFGIEDAWPVVTESFRQWVIEDRFVLGRPAWQEVGAQITDDVLPYEKMKLRLLNASHQALCYIGLLLGFEAVHEATQDADIRALVKYLMDREVTPLLPQVPGVDLEAYKATLIERFSNAAIADQLARISIYGSSGMPKFVLPSIEEQVERGGPIELLSFAVASWIFALGQHGRGLTLSDPMAPRLSCIARASGPDPRPMLAQRDIFSAALAGSDRFVAQVGASLKLLHERGAREALQAAMRG